MRTHPFCPSSPTTIFLSTLLFLLLPLSLFLLLTTSNLRQATFITTFSNAYTTQIPQTLMDPRILIGVITFADRIEVRHLHRLVNSLQPPVPGAQIDVKFVFCRLTRGEQRVLVGLEILRYDDIMILDCPKENMNNGKTYLFLSKVAEVFKGEMLPPYDYVMKADDDTYIRFPELVASLRPLPRKGLYYGLLVEKGFFREGDEPFMAGMGYALSWDLVEWIGSSEMVRNNSIGYEDRMVGKWLHDGGRGKNIYDTRPSAVQLAEFRRGGAGRIVDDKWVQYDLPRPPMRFLPNTVSVHRLKDRVAWAAVLRHFNVTANVKASKFYTL